MNLNLPLSHRATLTRLCGNFQTDPVTSGIGTLLIDGGCDTTLCGRGFLVESTTSRTVDVTGFSDKMKVTHLPVVSAVTAFDLNGETLIFEVNESIYVEDNETSLLSTFQAREYGIVINDTAHRHGGTQNILADGYDLPLNLLRGLFTMNIREPTEYERINCTRIILTGDQPWDVGDYDTPNPSTAYTSTSLIPSIPPIQKLLSIPFIQEDDMCQVVRANPSNTTVRDVDMLTYQARMGWMPMEVLTHTLSNTTQLAKNYFRLPLRRHFKSRFPQLNRNRLRETYATDTFFSSVTSIGGFTCAQLFSGKDSMFTKVYGMSTEAEGVVALETFVAEVGAPYHIISDNAKMQIGDAWKQVLRKYNISASTTEPHHPHQNPAERRI